MRRKIIDTSCGPIDLSGAGQPQLPYTLTKGVTATREGLVFKDAVVSRNDGPNFWEETTGLLKALQQLGKLQAHKNGVDGVVKWRDAAERLRYREGDPWCVATPKWNHVKELVCGGCDDERLQQACPLHRLAAILCDDANAFRVLHWCIENLGGDNAK